MPMILVDAQSYADMVQHAATTIAMLDNAHRLIDQGVVIMNDMQDTYDSTARIAEDAIALAEALAAENKSLRATIHERDLEIAALNATIAEIDGYLDFPPG